MNVFTPCPYRLMTMSDIFWQVSDYAQGISIIPKDIKGVCVSNGSGCLQSPQHGFAQSFAFCHPILIHCSENGVS